MPVLVAPDGAGSAWVEQRRTEIRATVAESGAVLLRGLGLADVAQVTAAATALADELAVEREGFAKRVEHSPGVYSSSVWASDLPMCMHHELSYARTIPQLMMFGCLRPADSGGTIGLADGAAIAQALPTALVTPFVRDGWLLTRNFYPEAGLSWQEAFGTTEPAEAEAYCRDNGIIAEWRADGVLRTRQRRAAVVTPAGRPDPVWFNQIAFLNRWTLDPDIRDYLVGEFGVHGLPVDTAYGDGRFINAPVIEEINAVYDSHTVQVPLRAGDLLVVDNLRMTHSREAYTGPREVVVAMGDPTDRAGWDPAWQR
ncbi:TauD/TfdA family dioxygenase [Micromonospora tarensis]|uniref:TauD/TfdA family dioxygenase n=1 Tax=Micromonospora tarensis TaxID=2806100 RepID=A0ABS1YB10_9ACTN|nr:TauD/TfdA family dioxygenase [Micromonospora tarensis]MBM0274426.1 TauD/TfdA family dioxygenase [Micromonospora tarensis]